MDNGRFVGDKRFRRRTENTGSNSAAESNPLYSPDGKWIGFLVSDDPPRWAGYRRIALIPAGGGAVKLLAETFDAQPNVIDWSSDGKSIYFSETRGTATRLYSIDVGSNAITELNNGNDVIGGLSLNRIAACLASQCRIQTRLRKLTSAVFKSFRTGSGESSQFGFTQIAAWKERSFDVEKLGRVGC